MPASGTSQPTSITAARPNHCPCLLRVGTPSQWISPDPCLRLSAGTIPSLCSQISCRSVYTWWQGRQRIRHRTWPISTSTRFSAITACKTSLCRTGTHDSRQISGPPCAAVYVFDVQCRLQVTPRRMGSRNGLSGRSRSVCARS